MPANRAHINVTTREAIHNSSWKERVARIQAQDAPLALLTQALHDPDETVREVAIWALHRLGEHAPVSALFETCTDESELVRAAAIEAIGDLLLMKLRQGLDDESDLVRAAALQAIGKLGGQQ